MKRSSTNPSSTAVTRPQKPTSKAPSRAKPPVVIWSNSAYVHDDQSSVASNTQQLHEEDEDGYDDCGTSGSSYLKPSSCRLFCEEELRLREELGREVEEELEKELVEGILALVRKLSDLKARRLVRDLAGRTAGDDDQEATGTSKKKNSAADKSTASPKKKAEENAKIRGNRLVLESEHSGISDAESRTTVVKPDRRRPQRQRERFR